LSVESLESFKRQPQTSTAKRIRCEAPTTSQQATDSQKAAGQETAGAHDASAQKGIGQESSADADQPRQSLSTTRVQQEAQQGRQPAPKEQGQQHSGEGAKGLEQVEPGLADLPDPLTAQQGPGKQQSNVACKRKANGQVGQVVQYMVLYTVLHSVDWGKGVGARPQQQLYKQEARLVIQSPFQ
jgi:hypothetical protein